MLGKDQNADFLRWVCDADCDITVADEVIAADRIAFGVNVVFPDGKRVFAHVIVPIENGKTARQVDVKLEARTSDKRFTPLPIVRLLP